ncbi:solute carrier family 28 member 3-like [Dermacentor variabilis]|uniref:solute carrier family 28 member 3-like n=1 Tax=Dermacentor variabilis TaxID=34621 RepID=UPI003F5B85E2
MPSQTTSAHYSLEGWRRYWPHWRAAQRLSEAVLVLLYHAYLAWCVQHGWHRGGWCSGGRFLLALTLLVYASLAMFGAAAALEAVARSRPGLGGLLAWRNRIWGTCLAVLFGAMLWDMNGELKRMSSLAGIVLLLLLGYVFSKNRNRVLPSLCYMAALLRILYYVGFMQAFLGNIHHYVNAGPSFNSYEVLIALVSAVNGPVESMLLVHPYLLTMSRSSLHCILTLDCGTASGRLMPIYVDLGERSRMLATFALCDSSNVGVAGTIVSLLSMLCPRKSELFASVVGHALFSSLATSVLAACVAGCLTR